MAKPRVVVLGEKPQGAAWLNAMLQSGLFDVVAGVARSGGQRWWGWDAFEETLKHHHIPVVKRAELVSMEYDILWSTMYGFIIEGEHITRAKWFGLNLHESPLPRYRGCNGYTHAILENDTTYGTTFHFLAPELDGGTVIDQEIFPIAPDETSKELYVRTMAVSEKLFMKWLPNVAEKNLPSRPNDVTGEPIRPRSSLIELKELKIDQLSLEDVYRSARAFDFLPFEPAFFTVNGKKFYVYLPGSEARGSAARELSLPRTRTMDALQDCCSNGSGALIDGFARPCVAIEESAYNAMYPIFLPRYSWMPSTTSDTIQTQ